jgi:hypothetical protein
MPHLRIRLSRQGIRWALAAAILLSLISGGLVVLVPCWRQQAAIADLQAVVVPLPGYSFNVVRREYDEARHGDAVTLVPGGPKWIRDFGGERLMRVFDRVERIGLDKCQSADSIAQHLPRFAHLRSFHLWESDLTDFGLELVSQCTQLEVLFLGGSEFTDEGLKHIAQLPRLKSLYLANPRITDAGIAHLENVAELEEISLVQTPLTDEALETICKLKGLRALHIEGHGITDAGVAQIGLLPKLESLGFYGTALTDEGLLALKRLPGLRELWINNSAITDAGLVHLNELHTLQMLGISTRSLTPSGEAIDQLKRERPDLQVWYRASAPNRID